MNYKKIALCFILVAGNTIASQKEIPTPKPLSYIEIIPHDIRALWIKHWFGLDSIAEKNDNTELKIKHKLFELIKGDKHTELAPFLYFFCVLSDGVKLHLLNPETPGRTPLDQVLYFIDYHHHYPSHCAKILLSTRRVYPTGDKGRDLYILHHACTRPDLLEYLLACSNQNINDPGSKGSTALHVAVWEKEPKSVALLLHQSNINIAIKDNNGLTPVDINNKFLTGAYPFDIRIFDYQAREEIGKLFFIFNLKKETR